jgi:hypothetical protein
MLQQASMNVLSLTHGLRHLVLGGAALLLAAGSIAPAHEEDKDIARRRAEQRTTFSDAEIADGFFKIAFGAEFNLAGRIDRIRKFEGPVRVFADSRGKPDRRRQVATVVADIRAHVAHLDIAMTADREAANVVVRLVRNRHIRRTIRAYFGREQADRIQRSLDPQCLSGFRKDESYRIQHADVILPIDAGNFIFIDCAYEELLQALGPINDDDSIPWTMFNDDVRLGFFGVYDQYLLNILYDPRVRPGMTVDEVRAVLPVVLPDVRAFVAKKNGIPP